MRKLTGVCLITQDVATLRDFYQAVLQVEAEGDDTFAALATEGAALSVFAAQGMEELAPGCMAGSGPGGCSLEFEIEDVDREYARLCDMKIPIVMPPLTHPWGRRSLWMRDPDGNIVALYATCPM